MVKAAQYVATFKETVGQVEQFMALAKNHVEDQIESQKEQCHIKSKNVQEFVQCVQPFELSSKELQVQYQLKNTFLQMKLDKCLARAEENYIFPCLMKLNKMMKPYLKEFEQQQ